MIQEGGKRVESTLAIKQATEFKKGIQSGISIAIGYMPIALTFGLIAKTTGLALSETVMMSLLVFAGAAQYISLSLLMQGIGIFEIVLTTLIVNIRHFLMSASLNEKAEEDSIAARMGYSFGITDETFSVAATRDGKVNAGYMFGLILISYSSWVINSGLGFLIGAGLPQTLQESMSVALYAMFVGLLVPSMKNNVKVVYLAVLAASFNSIFTLAELMSTGWAIVSATLLAAVIVEVVETFKNGGGAQADE
ncbi:MAG TPA: branched-chain amino acid ABC transporter permease [Bacillus bacterium]|nr:branched-chain amino acid ABC transporter permease [Bacillus sp. (in: firmicutes)]